MKLTIPLLFVTVTMVSAWPQPSPGPQNSGAPNLNQMISGANPAMRKAILDLVMQQLRGGMNNNQQQQWGPPPQQQQWGPPPQQQQQWGRPPPSWQQRPPQWGPPQNVFMRPPPQPRNNMNRAAPPQGMLAVAGTGAGGMSPMSAMMFGGSYCPPPSQMTFGTSYPDNCKDKIIYEALINKTTGQPLYSWVPKWGISPTSISDNVKDQVMNILIHKVMSSPTKKPTPKQIQLMHALGDPPNHVKHIFQMI